MSPFSRFSRGEKKRTSAYNYYKSSSVVHGFTGIQYGQKVFQPRISCSHDLSGSSLDQLSPGLSRTQKSAAVLRDEIIFPSVIPRSFLSHERSNYTLPQFQISSQSRPRSFENSALFNPAGLYATTPTSGSTMSIPIPIHIQHYDYVALTTSYQISIHLAGGEIIYLCWHHLDRSLYPSAFDHGFHLSTKRQPSCLFT